MIVDGMARRRQHRRDWFRGDGHRVRRGRARHHFTSRKRRSPTSSRRSSAKEITTVDVVNLYLARIKAYNGTCVNQPEGLLGSDYDDSARRPAERARHAEPAARHAEGVGLRRPQGAQHDGSRRTTIRRCRTRWRWRPQQDRKFAETGKLVGPLHGVVMAIKDWYDTFDMRTTAGADVLFANDRPPHDATFVSGCARRARSSWPRRTSASTAAAQRVRRHRLQSLRHRAHAGRLERRERRVGVRQSRDLLDRRGDRHLDPHSRALHERRRAGADAGAGQPRRHDRRRHQHARRADLPHRRGRGARPDGDRGLRPEGSADGLQLGRTPAQPYETLRARPSGSTASASASCASSWTRRLFTKTDEETIDIVEPRASRICARLARRSSIQGRKARSSSRASTSTRPQTLDQLFTRQVPELFPVDAQGKPTSDHTAHARGPGEGSVADARRGQDPRLWPGGGGGRRPLHAGALRPASAATRRSRPARDMSTKVRAITDPQFLAVTRRAAGRAAAAGRRSGRS